MARRSKVGGKLAGAGRPPSADPRHNKVTVKLTDDQHAAVRTAAEKEQRSVSDWGGAAFDLARVDALAHG